MDNANLDNLDTQTLEVTHIDTDGFKEVRHRTPSPAHSQPGSPKVLRANSFNFLAQLTGDDDDLDAMVEGEGPLTLLHVNIFMEH